MASSTTASMDIRLHPLVIMNICDHHTRDKLQRGSNRAFGALIGVQKGREVNIMDSMELVISDFKTEGDLDYAALAEDLALMKEVYPTYECLGWYATGDAIEPSDSAIHAEIQERFNARPLFLLAEPRVAEAARDLPVTIYEEQSHVVGDKISKEFVRTDFQLESDEGERVTVLHCAKVVSEESSDQSSVATHFRTLHKSVGELHKRMAVLAQYLRDVRDDKLKADPAVLREIKGLCSQLPLLQTPDFHQEFFTELNDSLLMTYLATITKGSALLSDALDKFNTAHGGSGRSRGVPGLGMGMSMPMSIGF